MIEQLWIANAIATWFMVGVIWLIQLVVYPGFRDVDPVRHHEAMLRHQSRTGRVVILPMLIELVTSILILWLQPESFLAWLGCVGVGVWGFSTVLIQVPLHAKLAKKGRDDKRLDRLVNWNWPRTVAWTAHGVICVIANSG